MKGIQKFDMITLLLVVSIATSLPRVSSAQARSTEVRIKAGNIVHYSLPTMPLERLASALKHDSRSPTFRLTWYTFLSSLDITYIVLYNRKSKTLKFHSSGLLFGKNMKEHYLYNNVTDSAIHKLAKRHRRTKDRPNDSFFSELRRFGCSRRRLP